MTDHLPYDELYKIRLELLREVDDFKISKNKDIIVSEEDAKEYLKWIKDKSFCQSGQHICDRLAILFAKKLKVSCL